MHDFDWSFGAPLGVFGFVILIILLNGIFSVIRTRAKQEVLREAIRSGQSVDPEILRSLQDSQEDEGSGVTAGLILMAVAVGLVFLGYQIGKVEPDEPIFDIMLGVAGIPFMIGLILFISGLFRGNKKTGE